MYSKILVLAILAVTAVQGNWTPRPTPGPQHPAKDFINYTTVTGFFAQDDPATDPGTFDYVSCQALRLQELNLCL